MKRKKIGVYLLGASNVEYVCKTFFNSLDTLLPDFDLVLLDKFKIKRVRKECSFESIVLSDFLDFDSVHDWSKLKEGFKDLLVKSGIDCIILFKASLLDNLRLDNFDLLKNYLNRKNEQVSGNFQMVKRIYESLCFVDAVSESDIDVIHSVIDPCEVNFSKVLNFKSYRSSYYLVREGFDFLPWYCYSLKDDGFIDRTREKQIDFCFRCSAIAKEREWLKNEYEWVVPGEKSIFEIFGGDFEGKRIPQDKYFDELMLSKGTLIIPSYDPDTFSIQRLVEALYCGCVPFVFDTCNFKEFNDTMPVLCDKIKQSLVVSSIQEAIDKTEGMSDKDVKDIIEDLLGCEDIVNLSDIDYVRDLWRKVFK